MSETAAPAPTQTPTPADTAAGAPPAAAPAPAGAPAAPPSILDPAAPEQPATADTSAVPETYEFKPQEIDGKPAEFDAGALDALRPIAKEAGLTQAQFQAVAEHGSKIIADKIAASQTAGEAAGVEAFKGMVAGWGAETKADPEMGGDKFPATLANVRKAINALGTPGLEKALVLTGAGNHPEMIRFLSRVGAAGGDPTTLTTGKPVGKAPADNPEQAAREFYNKAGGNYPDAPV